MKRILVRGLVLAAAVVALAAPVRAADVLNVGKASQTSSGILPVDVGAQTGIFARHGLDVEITNFEGSSKMHQAMVAGAIDIGVGAGPELALIVKGSPELAVCDAAPAATFLGIAVADDSPIHTIADLKGKKISVSSVGGMTYWLALELARKEGWGPDGITVVTIGNAAAAPVAALRTHIVDAAYTSTALAFFLEEKKEGRLLAPASAYEGNVGGSMIFAMKHLIATNPDAIRRFLAGWLEAVDYMRKHKAETVKIESAVTGYSQNVQAKEYDLTIGMFSDDCKFDAQSLSNLKRSFTDLKILPTPPDMSKLYTEAFLPQH